MGYRLKSGVERNNSIFNIISITNRFCGPANSAGPQNSTLAKKIMKIDLKIIIHKLFSRRNKNIPAIYGTAGAFLFIIGLFGISYGAAFLFWPLAIACFSLSFYPTLFAWGIIASCFLVASITYIGFTIIEILTKGTSSTIFSDGIIIYVLYVVIILILSIGILVTKPSKLK